MDTQFSQWIVSQTGVAGIAALALWMVRQAYEENDRRQREAVDREKQMSDKLVDVLQSHTVAVTKNTAALQELQRIVGHCTRISHPNQT